MSNWLDQVFVYFPHPWENRDWARITGLPLQDVWLETDDRVRLFGWYVDAGPARPVLLWCHGNAGNVVHRLENLAFLYRLGLSVFLFDYRGYGRSAGSPSEAGLYRDAQAAYDYVTRIRKIAPQRLILFGRSLGAAVAAELAVSSPAAGLILETPFPSIEAMAKAHYLGLPAHWLLEARYDLLEKLKRIAIPILVIHGDRDTIVPMALGREVFEMAREPKALYIVRGADHNNLYLVGGRPYFQRLRQFITDVAR